MGIGELFGDEEGPFEGLRKLWGDRQFQRRTRGTSDRTRALAIVHAISESCDLPQAEGLAKVLAECWAGEDGWDTEQLIKALGAGKVGVLNVQMEEPTARRE